MKTAFLVVRRAFGSACLFLTIVARSLPASAQAGEGPSPTPAPPPTTTPAAEAQPPAQKAATDGPTEDQRLRDLERQVKLLSDQLAEERATKTAPQKSQSPEAEHAHEVPTGGRPSDSSREGLWGINVTSYVQGQYESHADSEDQLRQGGIPLNQDRFVVRRARLKLEREWEYTAAMLEFDGNTTRGPAFSLHHAEASLQWRGDNPSPAPPVVRLTMGIFDVPFGYELVESPRTRLFLERSLASRDFFPSEPDVGIRVAGEIGWFRYALAFVNGEPNGVVNSFPLQDPNQNKDFVVKVGAHVDSDGLQISGDVSALNGKGFVKGTDATKNAVIWNDSMPADGSLRPTELSGLPAIAATPSRNFRRWAVGADVKVRLLWPLGWGQIFGEVAIASNMDRAQFVANPTLTNDVRELGFCAGIVQEVTAFLAFGFRADYYDPNADSADTEHGKLVPSNQRVITYSPLLSGQLPGRARLVFEYDIIQDHLARDALGVPTDLKNNAWTLRLQAEL